MIRVLSWNINMDKRRLRTNAPWKGKRPWCVLKGMDDEYKPDVALLQEAPRVPKEWETPLQAGEEEYCDKDLFDWRCRIIRLSDRIEVQHIRQVPPGIGMNENEIGVSRIGTLAAARVMPKQCPEDAFLAVSMYAQWNRLHPSAHKTWKAPDSSAHRILSDLSMFSATTDPKKPSKHRILAAGDLNMFYGAIGKRLSWPERERTVWQRFHSLGLEFLGPQWPNGRKSKSPPPDVQPNTLNVPTYHTSKQSPCEANRQLDYAFASRGFHKHISVRALNECCEWGPSDHCRLLIEVADT